MVDRKAPWTGYFRVVGEVHQDGEVYRLDDISDELKAKVIAEAFVKSDPNSYEAYVYNWRGEQIYPDKSKN